MEDTTITRRPRLKGLTFLSLQHQQENNEESREAVLRHAITNWTIQGFRWNNQPCNINDLSHILKVNPTTIMEHVSEVGKNLGGLADPDQVEDTIKSIISLSTTWAIQDRGIIMKQLETMLASQGGQYRPFISGEVNKALKLILDSNKNLMDGYKTFFTSNNTTTNILNIKGNSQDESDYISPYEALKLIQDNNPNNNNKQLPQDANHNTEPPVPTTNPAGIPEEQLQSLFKEHGVAETPGCRENRTGTEALKALGPDDQLGHEATRPTKTKPKKRESSHDDSFNRRGIDIEDIDALPSGS